jgi:hypothetical protein
MAAMPMAPLFRLLSAYTSIRREYKFSLPWMASIELLTQVSNEQTK